jgi:elongation factor G
MEPKVIVLLGQTDSGKTRLAEAFCKITGAELKSSKKEPTTYLKVYGIKYKDVPVYVLNTPGDDNFIGEVLWGLRMADAGILVVDSSSPLKYQNIRVFELAKEMEVPLFIFINKIDHEKSKYKETIEEVKNTLEINIAPLVYAFPDTDRPLLVDIIEEKVIKEEGKKLNFEDLPDNLKDEVNSLKEMLMEASAEGSDELIEKYLEEGALNKDEILKGLGLAFSEGKIFPLFSGSAKYLHGVLVLLERIINLAPSYKKKLEEGISNSDVGFIFKNFYDPFAGKLSYGRILSGKITSDSVIYTADGKEEKYTQIFVPVGDGLQSVKEVGEGEVVVFAKVEALKTGSTFSSSPIDKAISVPEMPHPMLTMAIHPETRADEDKISSAITKLKEEDPSLVIERDEETRELLISGIGPLHIEKTVEKLKTKYSVNVKLTPRKVPYRETIKKTVQGVIYRHKKQTGGRGQFAEVHFHIFPLERGKGFEFLETLTGMNVPRNYVPAVEKGVREAMEKGPLAGYPVVDVKVQFYDGKSHEVDSSDLAFKIAAFHCFKKGVEEANPVLLEPYWELEITVPDENVGDVVGDLNARRGRVMNIEKEKKHTKIKAVAPMAEILDYVISLQGLTAGRGSFVARFSHYEEVPPQIAEKIIAESKESAEKQ